jgi:hypothetical protein
LDKIPKKLSRSRVQKTEWSKNRHENGQISKRGGSIPKGVNLLAVNSADGGAVIHHKIRIISLEMNLYRIKGQDNGGAEDAQD